MAELVLTARAEWILTVSQKPAFAKAVHSIARMEWAKSRPFCHIWDKNRNSVQGTGRTTDSLFPPSRIDCCFFTHNSLSPALLLSFLYKNHLVPSHGITLLSDSIRFRHPCFLDPLQSPNTSEKANKNSSQDPSTRMCRDLHGLRSP